jgi:hypothetical protein
LFVLSFADLELVLVLRTDVLPKAFIFLCGVEIVEIVFWLIFVLSKTGVTLFLDIVNLVVDLGVWACKTSRFTYVTFFALSPEKVRPSFYCFFAEIVLDISTTDDFLLPIDLLYTAVLLAGGYIYLGKSTLV